MDLYGIAIRRNCAFRRTMGQSSGPGFLCLKRCTGFERIANLNPTPFDFQDTFEGFAPVHFPQARREVLCHEP